MQPGDQFFDFFRGFLCALGKAAHFVGNHRKTTTCLTGARRLDGRVERQQVGLLGHRFDHIKHTANLVTFALEMAHGFCGVTHFDGQFFNLGNRLAHHFVAFACLLIGRHSRFRGFFSIARHFLHRGSHFMHGGGDLVGFNFLTVDPGTGLFRHGREFFSRAGNLGHAIADAANQLAQAFGHALDRLLKLAQFVAPIRTGVLRQITGSYASDGLEGVLQRDNDLPGDGPCGHDAYQ